MCFSAADSFITASGSSQFYVATSLSKKETYERQRQQKTNPLLIDINVTA